MNTIISCAIRLLAMVTSASLYSQAKVFEAVFIDEQCVSEIFAADLPVFTRAEVTWPGSARIQAVQISLGDARVSEAVSSTRRWLRTILQPQWIPSEAFLELFALRGDVDGNDAIRCRYKAERFIIQLTSTSSGITVIIHDRDTPTLNRRVTEEEARQIVGDRIARFVQEAAKVEKNAFVHIYRANFGFRGNSDFASADSLYWWGLVHWWTDGRDVIMRFGKADGGPLLPSLRPDWFSFSPDLPKVRKDEIRSPDASLKTGPPP